MTRKILSIQNISCETLGTLEDFLELDGYVLDKVLAPQDSIPQSAIEFSAIIILGGPMSVYEGITYLNEEQVLIRDAFQKKVPTLGICLGSQLIAGALGGTVYRGAKKEIGWYDVYITDKGLDSIFRGFDQRKLRVFQWHGDSYWLPPQAEILAYSEHYPQAFRVGRTYGLQFHLEVTTNMIETWREEYKEETRKEEVGLEKIILEDSDETEELIRKCSLVWSNFSDIILRNKSNSI